MKICNTEAMKQIKELEKKKEILLYTENTKSTISYKEGETKKPSKYDYNQTRTKIKELDTQIRRLKHALAIANSTVVVQEFHMTIGEALIYLAQLNNEYRQLETLSSKDKLERRITANGVLEFTECLYDPEEVEQAQNNLYSEITKLQVAIDRANLNHYLDI